MGVVPEREAPAVQGAFPAAAGIKRALGKSLLNSWIIKKRDSAKAIYVAIMTMQVSEWRPYSVIVMRSAE